MTHKLWLATALLPILLSGCAAPLPPAQTQENCPDFTGGHLKINVIKCFDARKFNGNMFRL